MTQCEKVPTHDACALAWRSFQRIASDLGDFEAGSAMMEILSFATCYPSESSDSQTLQALEENLITILRGFSVMMHEVSEEARNGSIHGTRSKTLDFERSLFDTFTHLQYAGPSLFQWLCPNIRWKQRARTDRAVHVVGLSSVGMSGLIFFSPAPFSLRYLLFLPCMLLCVISICYMVWLLLQFNFKVCCKLLHQFDTWYVVFNGILMFVGASLEELLINEGIHIVHGLLAHFHCLVFVCGTAFLDACEVPILTKRCLLALIIAVTAFLIIGRYVSPGLADGQTITTLEMMGRQKITTINLIRPAMINIFVFFCKFLKGSLISNASVALRRQVILLPRDKSYDQQPLAAVAVKGKEERTVSSGRNPEAATSDLNCLGSHGQGAQSENLCSMRHVEVQALKAKLIKQSGDHAEVGTDEESGLQSLDGNVSMGLLQEQRVPAEVASEFDECEIKAVRNTVTTAQLTVYDADAHGLAELDEHVRQIMLAQREAQAVLILQQSTLVQREALVAEKENEVHERMRQLTEQQALLLQREALMVEKREGLPERLDALEPVSGKNAFKGERWTLSQAVALVEQEERTFAQMHHERFGASAEHLRVQPQVYAQSLYDMHSSYSLSALYPCEASRSQRLDQPAISNGENELEFTPPERQMLAFTKRPDSTATERFGSIHEKDYIGRTQRAGDLDSKGSRRFDDYNIQSADGATQWERTKKLMGWHD